MFHNIPAPVRHRMAYLEARDARDRQDNTPQSDRLHQIPPETGRFLALLAACAPQGAFLEIGTSAGYSSLWLGLACRARGVRLVTFEVQMNKALLAHKTFTGTQMTDAIQLIHGDARKFLPRYEQIGFCFLDADKEIYPACYELVVPRLVPGGLLVADNLLSHAEQLEPFRQRALSDERLDALVVPVGRGLLLCRRVSGKPDHSLA